MSSSPDLSLAEWVKSSYSNGNGGGCVEWAPTCIGSGAIPVRDSKDPHGPALTFPTSAWASFIAAVRQDAFGGV